jgi:uncharacterized protein (DUF1330 family)
MSRYFLAQIKIKDPDEYQKYLDKAGEIFKQYNGSYVAVDKNPIVLEGKWDYTRSVIIKFDTEEDFKAWYKSADYQQILKHRLKAADCDTILVKGLENY